MLELRNIYSVMEEWLNKLSMYTDNHHCYCSHCKSIFEDRDSGFDITSGYTTVYTCPNCNTQNDMKRITFLDFVTDNYAKVGKDISEGITIVDNSNFVTLNINKHNIDFIMKSPIDGKITAKSSLQLCNSDPILIALIDFYVKRKMTARVSKYDTFYALGYDLKPYALTERKKENKLTKSCYDSGNYFLFKNECNDMGRLFSFILKLRRWAKVNNCKINIDININDNYAKKRAIAEFYDDYEWYCSTFTNEEGE